MDLAVEAREGEGLLAEMAPFPNFILSTGCDLPQETPPQNIHAFMDGGREWRRHSVEKHPAVFPA